MGAQMARAAGLAWLGWLLWLLWLAWSLSGKAASVQLVVLADVASAKRSHPSAMRDWLPPAITVPLASRRVGESGAVLLRVVVADVSVLRRQISLHRRSGMARLDGGGDRGLGRLSARHGRPAPAPG